MSNFNRFLVTLDDGPSFEVSAGSREFMRMEKDGIDLSALPPAEATYTMIFYAVQRLVRQGKLECELPADVEAFMDWAEIEPVDVEDPEGKGSAPDPNTGGSPE